MARRGRKRSNPISIDLKALRCEGLSLLESHCDRDWQNAGFPGPAGCGRWSGATAPGKDQPSAGQVSRRHSLSWKAHRVLLSVGYFNPVERSAIAGAVSDRANAAVRPSLPPIDLEHSSTDSREGYFDDPCGVS